MWGCVWQHGSSLPGSCLQLEGCTVTGKYLQVERDLGNVEMDIRG